MVPLRVLVAFAALALTVHSDAEPLGTKLDTGYRQMYNLDFDGAHRTFGTWQQLNPGDPMGPVSRAAAYLFSEFERLHILESEFFTKDTSFTKPRRLTPDPLLKQRLEGELERSRQFAALVLARSPKDRNAMLAEVLRMGLHSDYLALIEKRNLKSLNEMKTARAFAEKLLAVHPDCYDAYLAIGVENYILSLKPAPLRWFLWITGAKPDKQEGLRRLRITAERGHYLKPFARLLLAVAALRDDNPSQAKALLRGLATEFPRNSLYGQELAKLD